MYNLQKTIRYGFWLILEVIALCVGMIYSARTVRAELEVQQPARKVTEVVTEKWTVISGKRLDLILKYMGDVNFEKEGISLRIPASVAQSWKVAENGTIQALVQKVSNHSYEIKIYKGTQKITDIPGSRIMIPVKEMFTNGNPETMEITDSRGRTSAAATVSITVVAYSAPSFSSYNSQRCNSSGTVSDDGTYIKATVSYSFASCSSKNTVTRSTYYRVAGTSTWTNACLLYTSPSPRDA